ncbi:unnamed protein product [Amaranthus hypochondriacus]
MDSEKGEEDFFENVTKTKATMKEISQQDNIHSEQDMLGKKRQRNLVADTSVKQTVGEEDVSMVESDGQGEQIVTDSFSSTPTSPGKGTRRQQ